MKWRKEETILLTMSEDTASKFVTIDGIRFRVRPSPGLSSNPGKPVVVLFHGYSFSLDEWEKIGTFEELSRRRMSYLAIDLPRGKATKSERREKSHLSDYVPILRDLLLELGVNPSRSKLIIVGPSMGGGFALSYSLERKEDILGLVLIAPLLAGLGEGSLETLDVPVLLIWGEKDTVFPVEQNGHWLKQILPSAKLLIIKGARHPAYLDRPQEFHDLLFDFIEELTS